MANGYIDHGTDIGYQEIMQALVPLHGLAWVLTDALKPGPDSQLLALALIIEQRIGWAINKAMERQMEELVPIAYAKRLALDCAPPLSKSRKPPRTRAKAL